jgi:hypothetical protein
MREAETGDIQLAHIGEIAVAPASEIGLVQKRVLLSSFGTHRSLGFEVSGVLRPAGFKRGRWVDVVVMQRRLDDGDAFAPAGQGWMPPA